MRYGMVIDLDRCLGCHTCAVACRIENNLPQQTWWNRICTDGGAELDTPAGQFPNTSLSYVPIACQHCENPACTKVCPVGATYKDEETGAVRQDYDRCIGCRMCMAACPYTGVRSFNWEEPTYMMDFSTGDPDVPKHQKHVVEKCTLCYHRLVKDEKPFCIQACPGRARFFGDLDDPDSKVSQMIRERPTHQLLPEKSTNPAIYYLA